MIDLDTARAWLQEHLQEVELTDEAVLDRAAAVMARGEPRDPS